MRYRVALTLLVLAAAPLRAQEAGATKRGEDHAGHAAMGAKNDPHAEMAADWKKIQEHWVLVKGLEGDEKARHLEMHRSMLAGFMERHAAPPGAPDVAEVAGAVSDPGAAARDGLWEHWRMVQEIEDPAQLETHLAMHMEMVVKVPFERHKHGLEKAEGEEQEGAGHGREGHGEADHEEMEHEMEHETEHETEHDGKDHDTDHDTDQKGTDHDAGY